jgi:hypothetical protein
VSRRDLLSQIASALVALGGGAVLTSLALLEASPYRSALLLAGIVGLVVGVFMWGWLLATSGKDGLIQSAVPLPAPTTPSPPPPAPSYGNLTEAEKPTLPKSVTAQYLIGLCRDKTGIESEGAVSRFIGHRLEVSGEIYAADRLGEQTSVGIQLERNRTFPVGYLIFAKDQERVGLMRYGDWITVIGRLIDVGSTQVRLEDCRLID